MAIIPWVSVSVRFERPRPRAAKSQPASKTLSVDERKTLAADALYVGSPHHADVPKYGGPSSPREGFFTVEEAEEQKLKNPSCVVCPRKWVRRQAEATRLLRTAIESGMFVSEGARQKPQILWARDPEDRGIVYEAKLLTYPSNGYKAYPLTAFQADNLPFKIP